MKKEKKKTTLKQIREDLGYIIIYNTHSKHRIMQ